MNDGDRPIPHTPAGARYLSAKSRRGSHLRDGWELEQVDAEDERSDTW